MSFPYDLRLPGVTIPIHLVCEILAYTVGFRLYLRARRRQPGGMTVEQAVWTLVGCLAGAALGSKLVAWLEVFPLYWQHRANPLIWLQGKSIVGGLLGGWLGVEVAKRFAGVSQATGDAYVFPLIVGIAIGRIGCFLTGLSDGTCGIATSLPWGVDFGDGLRRHPTQLYEILYLTGLGWLLWTWKLPGAPDGARFRQFLIGYFAFRFAIEFIKPHPFPYLIGLTAIQFVALLGLVAAAISLWRQWRPTLPHAPATAHSTAKGSPAHG
ncbi:prolipoprotein diacylglyceryl transferase [Chloracidobacterium thermophilum]|uniref:Prolipoprotein diacylglyceryltransferase n=1 Tax=Chloracidobacterium thermophilum (strain B) TaxID=981222 RepID=G2LHR9_CHLTF|nr:prolipoprotein diacylglyceryl transferase family protein [Chloracidobacterium thermophilum]AEP10979.1 Prolipoprotein diacylglyceryltransferase [Chloracidobacterium thermophilum B]QUV78907.1 prolipoprotein diacylglyceryl transferase [Chloracidobacterium thermophilum]